MYQTVYTTWIRELRLDDLFNEFSDADRKFYEEENIFCPRSRLGVWVEASGQASKELAAKLIELGKSDKSDKSDLMEEVEAIFLKYRESVVVRRYDYSGVLGCCGNCGGHHNEGRVCFELRLEDRDSRDLNIEVEL